MTPKKELDKIAILSEILVDVSKSHIMPNEAINQIRKLNIGELYFMLKVALTRAKKVDELLGLYQKKEQCIVCAPLFKDSSILHCVVRYSEDEKYMRILNQIKQLEEELK